MGFTGGVVVGAVLMFGLAVAAMLANHRLEIRRGLGIIAVHQPADPRAARRVCQVCGDHWPCEPHQLVSNFFAERTRYYRTARQSKR